MFGDHPGFTADDNDLFDPGRVGWYWLLCEGCGLHVFDPAGTRLCTDPPAGFPRADPLSPVGGMHPCTACIYLGREWLPPQD
jgi:hypothetical protein